MDKIIICVVIGIALLIAVLFSGCCNASVSAREVKQIYKQLIKKNKLKAPHLYLMKDNDINGFTMKDKIMITTGALRYCTKAEIALILAHELTHYKFNDVDNNWYNVGTFMEDSADVFGAQYAENIGYPKCRQAQLFVLFHY